MCYKYGGQCGQWVSSAWQTRKVSYRHLLHALLKLFPRGKWTDIDASRATVDYACPKMTGLVYSSVSESTIESCRIPVRWGLHVSGIQPAAVNFDGGTVVNLADPSYLTWSPYSLTVLSHPRRHI